MRYGLANSTFEPTHRSAEVFNALTLNYISYREGVCFRVLSDLSLFNGKQVMRGIKDLKSLFSDFKTGLFSLVGQGMLSRQIPISFEGELSSSSIDLVEVL